MAPLSTKRECHKSTGMILSFYVRIFINLSFTSLNYCWYSSVSVLLLLEWSLHRDINIVSLFLGELGELGVESGQVKSSDLLVELLGQDVDGSVLVLVVILVFPKLELGQHLVGEGAGHHERWVTSSATQVQETALSQKDDTVAIREDVSIDLLLDVGALDTGVALETLKIDLVIEVTNVTDDSVVLHLSHMLGHDDVLVTGGGDKDISGVDDRLNALDFVAFHAGLKGADGVDLSHDDTGALGLHGGGAALADITESTDDDLLTSKHDIGSAHKTIGKRVLATIDVVELLLGDRVVDVDGLEEELALLGHLLETVNTGGGFLGETNELLAHLGPHVSDTLFKGSSDDGKNDLEFLVLGGGGVGEGSELLEVGLSLDTLVHHDGGITTVVHKHVGTGVSGPAEHLESALPVFLEGLSLPGEDVSGLGLDDGSGGLVLGRVDVAGCPSDLSTKIDEGLDEDGSLDGHVEGAGNAGTSEGLLAFVFLADVHKTGHLDFSDVEFLAAPFSEGDVLDLGFK
jgi:hypothetical protein